jgi:acyl-coenzyme A synthetase/AMP-(fatty) acid ligase
VNIAPIEIDNVLLAHPALSQAAAIGVPDAIYGEEVVCYVVAKPGQTADKVNILTHCGKSLPEFKTPKHIYVIDDLPKSDRGKILRDKIRELWDRDHGS